MELTEAQFARIQSVFPRQRGNVRLSNLDVLNAMLYVMEKRCQWRALPEEFGNWNSIYVRVKRWAEKGVIDKIFTALQREGLISLRFEMAALERAVLPDKQPRQPKFVWLPLLPLAAGIRAPARKGPQ